MTYCNADNCKHYMDIDYDGIVGVCGATKKIIRVDNDTDDMTCKTFKYKKKEK